MADLRALAALPQASSHLHDLRSEAAAALTALDLRPVKTLAEGFMAYAPAYSPDGAMLALPGWQTLPDGRGVVRLYDPSSRELLHELSFPIDPTWALKTDKLDGCRSIAFNPDGRWLVAGTRGLDDGLHDLLFETSATIFAHTLAEMVMSSSDRLLSATMMQAIAWRMGSVPPVARS